MDTRAILKYEKNSVCQRTDFHSFTKGKRIASTNTVFAASQICSIFPGSHRYNIKVSIFVFFIPFKGPLKKKRIEVLEGKGLDRKGRVKKKEKHRLM